MCEHLYQFLRKCTMPGGRLPYIVDREGKAKTIREHYYYSEGFALMGCAQYYRICGREDVWETANLYYDALYNGYVKRNEQSQSVKQAVPCRTFGYQMATLANAQFIRNVGIDTEKYDALALACVEAMMHDGFVDDERGEIMEYVSLTGEKLDAPLCYSACPGHIYEAAWFVMAEGEYRNDDKIRNFGRKLLDMAMPKDFEKVTKLIPTIRNTSKPLEEDLESELYLGWPQEEATIAYLLAYRLFGDEKYLRLSEMIEQEAFTWFEDKEAGRWFREIRLSSGPAATCKEKGDHILGPFHLERFLLAMGSMQETGSILQYMN